MRWHTVNTPYMATPSVSASSDSPTATLAPSSRSASAASGRRTYARTSGKERRNAVTTAGPIQPAAPVTRTVMEPMLSAGRRASSLVASATPDLQLQLAATIGNDGRDGAQSRERRDRGAPAAWSSPDAAAARDRHRGDEDERPHRPHGARAEGPRRHARRQRL